MLDATQKRTILIEHLANAAGLADELGDAALVYLIERALDEARALQVKAIDDRRSVQPSR
jgi:hypothetical protein